MWTYGVEVPSNVVLPSTGTLQCGPAQNGRYLPTLEGTSGTLQVGRYTRTLRANSLTVLTQAKEESASHHCLGTTDASPSQLPVRIWLN